VLDPRPWTLGAKRTLRLDAGEQSAATGWKTGKYAIFTVGK